MPVDNDLVPIVLLYLKQEKCIDLHLDIREVVPFQQVVTVQRHNPSLIPVDSEGLLLIPHHLEAPDPEKLGEKGSSKK